MLRCLRVCQSESAADSRPADSCLSLVVCFSEAGEEIQEQGRANIKSQETETENKELENTQGEGFSSFPAKIENLHVCVL